MENKCCKKIYIKPTIVSFNVPAADAVALCDGGYQANGVCSNGNLAFVGECQSGTGPGNRCTIGGTPMWCVSGSNVLLT
jgi:hypothetical protein